MTHLFVDPADMTGDTLIITGADYNHIKNVLRMRPGDELSVSNGTDSREYRYGIEEIREDGIVCRLRFIKEADVELPVRMTLFQGLPKGEKMEWIVQKCTELGVFSMDVRLLPYERAENGRGTREIFESIRPGSTVAVFIGPEGGFAPEEVTLAQERAGVQPITLGRRILRTETAGMTVLSWLIYTQEIQ